MAVKGNGLPGFDRGEYSEAGIESPPPFGIVDRRFVVGADGGQHGFEFVQIQRIDRRRVRSLMGDFFSAVLALDHRRAREEIPFGGAVLADCADRTMYCMLNNGLVINVVNMA